MNRVVRAWSQAGITAALVFSLYCTAQASEQQNTTEPSTIEPSGSITVNGEVYDFSKLLTLNPQSGLYVVPLTTQIVGGQTVTFGVMGDPDPVLSYSFSATNNSKTAIPFAFDLAIPIMPVAVGNALSSSLGISLTDGGKDGAMLTPFVSSSHASPFMQAATGDNSDLGLGIGGRTQNIDIGTTVRGALGKTSVTAFNGDDTSPLAFSNLGVHLSFLLTPNGDSVGTTGSVEVSSVPEPSTYAFLVTSALTGAAFLRRRKQARRAA